MDSSASEPSTLIMEVETFLAFCTLETGELLLPSTAYTAEEV